MRMGFLAAAAATVMLFSPSAKAATIPYWNVFNIEGESDLNADFVTYNTLADMLNDENRTGIYTPDGSGSFGTNIVDSGSDGTTWWNLFNIEGESDLDAAFVTYASFEDMANDENRIAVHNPDGSGSFGPNIVGSGTDGIRYWNVFNIEGETLLDAAIVTYNLLSDMLQDINRTGVYAPDGSGSFGTNIVDSGSDGKIWWNLFNVEGENDLDAAFVTYASFEDMANDQNRIAVYSPDGSGSFGTNIVGSGSYIAPDPNPPAPVPLPATAPLLLAGLGMLILRREGLRQMLAKW